MKTDTVTAPFTAVNGDYTGEFRSFTVKILPVTVPYCSVLSRKPTASNTAVYTRTVYGMINGCLRWSYKGRIAIVDGSKYSAFHSLLPRIVHLFSAIPNLLLTFNCRVLLFSFPIIYFVSTKKYIKRENNTKIMKESERRRKLFLFT
jgi:hypothetical protein